ncbi:AGAP009916-PB [Anopheles gambiae str. PEST]|uniref:AGAP009916-PB n=1 Tax=Anopheles gambiae TaxID=7165 RepID=Q5TP10_ANOGA|nr:AGAP009916-PB [Anopheles gambiae str. PEST]
MGDNGNRLQYQQLLNVSFGDEFEVFHTQVSEQHVLLVRNQRALNCYRLEGESREWKALWIRDGFFDGKQREFRSSFFVDESGWLLVRNREGLQFYRMEGSDLTLRHYCSEAIYRNGYGWDDANTVFLMGRIYTAAGTIGILTRNKRGAIRFEQMQESAVLKGGPRPLWQLYDSPTLPESWKFNSTWLGLATTYGTEQSAIIERSSDVVSVYMLDNNYHPKLVGRAENVPFSSAHDERILFGNILDSTEYSDMLHLNSSGMFLYQRDNTHYRAVAQSTSLAVFGRGKKVWNSASLIDVDRDGKDELWLTGPQGIMGFRISNGRFEQVPFNSDQNEDLRYAQIIKTIPDGHNVTAIAVSGQSLVSFCLASSKTLVNEANKNDGNDQSVQSSKEIKSVFALHSQTAPLVEASLGEQLDTSLLIEPVNPMNGNLEFGIPLLVVGKLFGMSTVKFITYQEASEISGSMGVGWSLQVDCVYIDRRNNIFPEEHRYYLIKDGSSFPLTITSNDSNEQIITFSTASTEQMTVTFNRPLNQWTLEDGNGESFIYGTYGDKQAVKMDSGSEHWPFMTERSELKDRLPSVWYLVRQFDRADQWMEYTYTKDPLTDDYQLSAISTSNTASLQLSYSNQYNSTLLTGYTIRTLSYQQSAVLHYVQQEDKVHLKRITQQSHTALEFDYEGPNGAMSKIIYPNGLIAKFDYTLLQIDSNMLINHFKIHSHPRTAYGPTYLLIGDITKHGQVRIQLRDHLGSDTVAVDGSSIPPLGKFPVIHYEMYTGESFFAVLLQHERTQSELCLFHQTQPDVWQAIPTYLKIPKDSSIRAGHDFLLAIQEQCVTVIERQQGRWKALKPFDIEKSSLIHFFTHGFLTYDDRQLRMFVRRNGDWTGVVLPFPANLIKSSSSLFDRFDHPEEIMRDFKKGVQMDALQMFHNIIVFRSLFLDGFKMYARLHLLHLNWKHEVHRQSTIDVLIEDLHTYTFNPPETDGNTFVFAYQLDKEKFRLKVISHHGKIMDEVDKIKAQIEQDIRDQPNAPEEEKIRYRNESYEKINSELQELYRNITSQIPFAIDPSKFGILVNDAYIVTASHKVLFDGIDWNMERIPQEELTLESITVNLGPSYRLVKTHRNATFDLIGPNNAVVFNTDTNNATELNIRYPAFMAVQANDSAVQLFNFQRNKLTSLPVGEVFDTNSNTLAVISRTNDGKNVFVRSMDSFGITRKHVVWRHEFVDGRGRTLTNYYEFNAHTAKPYHGGFLMTDVKITPANTEGRFGWFKVHYNHANNTLSTKSVYDSTGKFVKLVQPADTNGKTSPDADGVLMARDAKTVVADFRPYRISEEIVTYYGFEPYEQNQIGSDGRWKWNGGTIQIEQGNHFLHLTRSGSVSATLMPKIQFSSLIVSCWLRGSNKQQNIENALSVNCNGKVVHGSVGFSIGGWSYVEVMVDNTNRLEVYISSGSNSTIDVDHLRVFPAQLDLNVHIYDTTLALERSTLHATGLLSHRLYDVLGNEIGRINKLGSIENLSFQSRISNCRIEIQPAYGEILQKTKQNTFAGSMQHVPDTAALRFRYAATTYSGDIQIEIATLKFRMHIAKDQSTLKVKSQSIAVPREGDMVVFHSSKHFSIWIDGHLKVENLITSNESRSNRYEIRSNNVQTFDAMLLYDVNMKVIYLTDFGMPKQIVELKDTGTVALQEILYDELNRPAVRTKWTDLDTTNSSILFSYRHNFIEKEERFWKTGQMEGTVTLLNSDCEGFPYSRTVYMDNPLEDKSIQSLPGKSFAIDGRFAQHFSSIQGIDFLTNLFPTQDGFYYESEQYPDQSVYVLVYDKRKLKVASYVKTHHGDHHLTTYMYDTNDRLVLQLPPAYHEQADTFSRTIPFFGGNFSPEHTELQRTWGMRYEYDNQSGLLTLKRTPDAGNTRYMYTPEGLLRFVVQQNSSNVMYYTYNSVGKLKQRGIVKLSSNELSNYLPNDSDLPASSNFILLHHGENSVAPLHRHRVENIQKISGDHILSDVLLSNHQSQIITSALYSSGNESLAINYEYQKNQIHEIHYPVSVKGKRFRLRYSYDNRGKLIGISNAATDEKFIAIDNNSLGLPKRVLIQPNSRHAYQRTYHYNEPGYLTRIEDPYLTETIDYSGSGYGGRAIGDGTVQATRFHASWHAHSNLKLLKLKPSHLGTGRRAKFCYDALVSAGYLDSQGRPLKSLYLMLELRLPLVCRLGTYGHQVAAALNSRGFPQFYGHRYDYGSHRQLIRAKYFQSSAEELFNPLRKDTFEQIQGISQESSTDIWHKLVDAGYLHTDCYSTSAKKCHGLPGKSLFHPTIAGHPNAVTLSSLLVRVITQRKNLAKNMFDQLCAGWYKDDIPDAIADTCNSVWTILSNEGLIGPKSNFSMTAINQELRDLLSEYASHLPAIIGALYHKFATALGHNSADVQSYKIDANGNHQHFYTGFRRYRLEYVKNTNKISSVYRTNFAARSGLDETRYQVEHDEEGNVVRATHKGIERIIYDPLFNRPSKIMLSDGRYLEFEYDVRGYRLYKYVYDSAGRLSRKKYYIRDVQGKPLIEYEGIYEGKESENNAPSVVRATVFVYADDRLVGFVRNDQFYSVWLDHERSVRLVIKNGEIVAAYDYLPYGELLRSYGDDPDGHLDYRFTGQEWDEETNLYNFHARLYDPELGRFLQLDPKEQYASPYLYAGNSPVSLIDPDGQFAILLIVSIVTAAVGAYLGASAANKSWNPAKWEVKKAIVGATMGAIVGGFAPVGIAGSITFLAGAVGTTAAVGITAATSVGFAYVSTAIASANGSWDPSKWDWSQPGTWNALFIGSLTGASLFNAVGGVHKAFIGYTGISRTAFVIVTSGATGGFFLYSGSMANDGNLRFWEWDWSKPATVWGALEGASFGLSISPKLNSVTQQVTQRLDKFKEIGKALKENNLKLAGTLIKEEVGKWKQIGYDVLKNDVTQDAITAGKAIGRPGGTILLDKIPPEAMKVIDEILAIDKLLKGTIRKKKHRRSIEYGNMTSILPSYHNITNNNSVMRLEYCIDCSQDASSITSKSYKVTNWINEIFEHFFNTENQGKQDQEDRKVNPYLKHHKRPTKTPFHIANCFRTNSADNLNTITCYEQHGLSYVFPHNTSNITGITEDHYSSCYPIEYNGLLTTACAGTNSSYMYTPYIRPVNYLDQLNGTLTLLLVAPTVVRNIASGLRNLFFKKKPEQQAHEVSTLEHSQIDKQFHDLKQTVQEYRQLADNRNSGNWLDNIFKDIEEDFNVFLSTVNPSRTFYYQLCERIAALSDELEESRHILQHKLYSNNSQSLNNFTFGLHTQEIFPLQFNKASSMATINEYRVC